MIFGYQNRLTKEKVQDRLLRPKRPMLIPVTHEGEKKRGDHRLGCAASQPAIDINIGSNLCSLN
jgi:hypothetical protein